MNHKARRQFLAKSIYEAERFIEKAKLAQKRYTELDKGKYLPCNMAEFASAKRASMDLTRVLAKLRNAKTYMIIRRKND